MDRAQIFDVVRKLLGRSFHPAEVVQLDDAIDRACCGSTAARLLHPSLAGLALIRKWEGCAKRRADGRFDAYPDPGTGSDPWTIGWGSTGHGIGPGLIWTQDQCDARLESDVSRFAREVTAAIGNAPASQNQFDALVSFHYNTGAIAKATLTKLHRTGDYRNATLEFGKWVHAGGRVLQGLVKRRSEEAALYSRAAASI